MLIGVIIKGKKARDIPVTDEECATMQRDNTWTMNIIRLLTHNP